MFLISFAKSLPRLASITAFLCFVVAHLEWPDICLLLRVTKIESNPRDPTGVRSVHCAHHVHEQSMYAMIAGQFGMERGGEGVFLPDGHDVPAVFGDDLGLGPDRLDPGRPDEDAVHRTAVDAVDLDRGLERLVLPAEGVAPHDHVDAADGLLA